MKQEKSSKWKAASTKKQVANSSQKIAIIITTPTQPQLNSKVGFDTKMTLDHHQYHKLNVINISAVPDNNNNNISLIIDPILTKL